MKNLAFILISLVIAAFFVSAYSQNTEKDIADNVIRLHITAESDSDIDQAVKLKVRDRITSDMAPVLSAAGSKEESEKLVMENMDRIRAAANDELMKNGMSYTAECFLGRSRFPVKTYGDITFPPGEYTALRIILGSGEGKNWWCVMYPPLCFVEGDTVMTDEGKNILKNNMDGDSYSLITESGSDPDIKIKFKIVELFQEFNK
ncbi:MAG: stage II sporulation protein R [Oscillospiraceae bacterium]|nr:stage II sporulation protein R [Oscillospiraceae bacterium]